MKQPFRIIGSVLLSVSLVSALAFAQDDAAGDADDSVAADPTVNVQGLEIAGGTIASYLESRSATNPSEGGFCFDQPNDNVAPEASDSTAGTDDATDDGTATDEASSDDASDETLVAGGDASYTCLVQALTATGLLETLNAEGNYTLFAPTDVAFASLADSMTDSEFQALLADTAQLTEILNYHVATEARTLSDLSTAALSAPISLTTVQGSDITITFEDDASEDSDATEINEEAVVRVGSSAASTADLEGDAFVTQEAVQTDNGVVIGISEVLMLPEEEAAQ